MVRGQPLIFPGETGVRLRQTLLPTAPLGLRVRVLPQVCCRPGPGLRVCLPRRRQRVAAG